MISEVIENNTVVYIVATKCDLLSYDDTLPDEIIEFSSKINAPIHQVSAKQNDGLDKLFADIALATMEKPKNSRSSISLKASSHSKLSISAMRKSKKCC